jgi:hypothetical protein
MGAQGAQPPKNGGFRPGQWVTQMNHIPKDVDYNKQKPWVRQWALWRKYLIIQPLIQLLIQLSI